MNSSPGQDRSSNVVRSDVFRMYASSSPSRRASAQGGRNPLSRVNRHSATGVRASQMRRAPSTAHSVSSSVHGRTPSEPSSTTSQPKSASCFVCQRVSPVEPTSLITCSKCRRKYHRGCHKPVVREDPGPHWRCYRCPVSSTNDTMPFSDKPLRKKLKPSPLNDNSRQIGITRDEIPETPEEKLKGQKIASLQRHAKSRFGSYSNNANGTTSSSPAASSQPNESVETNGKGVESVFFPADLAAMALLEVPDHRLEITQIYEWVSEHIPGYDMKDTGWQDEIAVALTIKSKGLKPVFERISKVLQTQDGQWALRQGAERSVLRWDPSASAASRIMNTVRLSNKVGDKLASHPRSANSKRKRSEAHTPGDVETVDHIIGGQGELKRSLHSGSVVPFVEESQSPAPPSAGLAQSTIHTSENGSMSSNGHDVDMLKLSQDAKDAETQVRETEQQLQESASQGEQVPSSLQERLVQERIIMHTARERIVVAARTQHERGGLTNTEGLLKDPSNWTDLRDEMGHSPELGATNGIGELGAEMESSTSVPTYCDATTQTLAPPGHFVDTRGDRQIDGHNELTEGPQRLGNLKEDEMEGILLENGDHTANTVHQFHMYDAVQTTPTPIDEDQDLETRLEALTALSLRQQFAPNFTSSTKTLTSSSKDTDQASQNSQGTNIRPTRKQTFGRPGMSRFASTSVADRLGTLELGARYAEKVPPSESKRKQEMDLEEEDFGEVYESVEELLGMPDRIVPMIHETQLAFRDFTPTTAGRVGRPKIIYKVGPNARF